MTDGPPRSPSGQMRALGIPPEVLADLCSDVERRVKEALEGKRPEEAAADVVKAVLWSVGNAWLHGHERGKTTALDPDATLPRPLRRIPTSR